MSDAHQPPTGPTPPPPPPLPPPPPGYVAYGGPGAAMSGQFQPIRGLAQAAVVLQAITAGLSVIVLIIQLSLRDDARAFLDGATTKKDFDDVTGGFGLVSLLNGGLSLALLVILIIWSWRISSNLRNYGRAPLSWKPPLSIVVWLLGGCTLNIINFLMLREHWRGSDSEVGAGDTSWKSRPVDQLIVVWFVLSVVGAAMSITVLGAGGLLNDVDLGDSSVTFAKQLRDHAAGTAVSTLVSLAANVVFIFVIRALSARHMRLTREA